jgi:hypothetical protein
MIATGVARLFTAVSLTALLAASPSYGAGQPGGLPQAEPGNAVPARPDAAPKNQDSRQSTTMTEAGKQAQHLIFEASHLDSVKAPSNIYYSYSVSAAAQEYGKGFDDSVRLNVTQNAGQPKDATLYMFTGDRQRDPMPFAKRLSNPVILMFLEQDLWHMRQRIGGRADYFKSRIAAALREQVEVEQMTRMVDGREVPVTKMTIKPFLNDPNGERLQAYRTKTYEFLLSDAVPGEVVELRTAVYDPASRETKLLLEERLAYQRVESGS